MNNPATINSRFVFISPGFLERPFGYLEVCRLSASGKTEIIQRSDSIHCFIGRTNISWTKPKWTQA